MELILDTIDDVHIGRVTGRLETSVSEDFRGALERVLRECPGPVVLDLEGVGFIASACLGAMVAFHSPVLQGRAVKGGVELEVGGKEPMNLNCRLVVNSAGLHAPALAKKIAGMPSNQVPSAYYAKGNYFTLAGISPFSRLIYPVPVPGGLGVHITVDLGGQAKFGPDVEWIDKIDYEVDPHRADKFYAAVRRYWPDLKDGALHPGYAGIRPKIVPPGASAQDFQIQGPADHGVPGLINLFGIESPGLTASLALAELVRDIASA